jgi:hypothetical protein
MNDYDKLEWFDLYRTALLELKRPAMTGRISDACAREHRKTPEPRAELCPGKPAR